MPPVKEQVWVGVEDSESTTMDQSLSFSSASFSSNHLLEEKYKLAYKQFINKSFEKSYRLITELYEQSFNEFSKGFISEVLFKKIINLYLTQVGLTVSGQTLPFKLTQIETHRLVNVFVQDTFLDQLAQVFGGSEINIPLEIMYNYTLVLITNRNKLIVNDNAFLTKVRTIYSSLTVNDSNPKYSGYVKRFIDLYVFEVLPTFDLFDESEHVIESHPVFANDVGTPLNNLRKIQQNKLQIVEQQKQRELDRKKKEQELQQRELQKLKEQEKQQNLQYKSIKDIRKEYSAPLSASSSDQSKVTINKDTDVNKLSEIKDKLFYSYKLIKNYIKENSPLILVILVLLFIFNRFINLRQIKLKDKLLETIKMAFKVSYL